MIKKVSLCLLLCITFQLSPSAVASSPIKVAFINPAPKGFGFWDTVVTYMRASAIDLNIDLKIYYAIPKQRDANLKNIKKLLESSTKPDFLISSFQKQTTLKLLNLSKRYKVGFYSINTQVPDELIESSGYPRGKYEYWLGQSIPNDKQAGYLMASSLINQIKESEDYIQPIQLLAVTGTRDSSASFERNKGLYKALKEHSDVLLNQLVFTDWSSLGAYKKAKGLLLRYPKTQIIWAASDSIAIGAYQAIKEKAIITAGIDWSESGIDAVEKQQLTSTYGGHFLEGGFALVMLYDYFHGKDFIQDPGIINSTQYTKIDFRNINDFKGIYSKKYAEEIDFRRFSKVLTPSVIKYNFSWDAIQKQVDKR